MAPNDYWFWSGAEKALKQANVTTVEEMIASLNAHVEAVNADEDLVKRSVQHILKRARLCIEMEGGHFEHLLKKKRPGVTEHGDDSSDDDSEDSSDDDSDGGDSEDSSEEEEEGSMDEENNLEEDENEGGVGMEENEDAIETMDETDNEEEEEQDNFDEMMNLVTNKDYLKIKINPQVQKSFSKEQCQETDAQIARIHAQYANRKRFDFDSDSDEEVSFNFKSR